jgi:hypothetical protein
MTDLGSAVTLQLSDGDKVLEPYRHERCPDCDETGNQPSQFGDPAITIDELIKLITEAREDLGGDAQIRIAYQPCAVPKPGVPC